MADMSQCAAPLETLTGTDPTGPMQSRHAGLQAEPAATGQTGRTTIPRAERQAILLRTVKLAVIPQLLALVQAPEPAPIAAITPDHVAALADLAVYGTDDAASALVAELRERGVPAEALFLDLLTPVARRLGEWWEQDVCGFTEVTTGLWRLQDAMHGLRPAFLSAAPLPTGPRILLLPVPGEQHTFGLSMLHEFFRRAGWTVWSGPVDNRAELQEAVRSQWVDVVGFSMGSDDRLDAAREEIRAVRAASRNPCLVVLIGGPPFVADPGLASALGADGTAADGAQAVAVAASLVGHDEGRRRRSG